MAVPPSKRPRNQMDTWEATDLPVNPRDQIEDAVETRHLNVSAYDYDTNVNVGDYKYSGTYPQQFIRLFYHNKVTQSRKNNDQTFVVNGQTFVIPADDTIHERRYTDYFAGLYGQTNRYEIDNNTGQAKQYYSNKSILFGTAQLINANIGKEKPPGIDNPYSVRIGLNLGTLETRLLRTAPLRWTGLHNYSLFEALHSDTWIFGRKVNYEESAYVKSLRAAIDLYNNDPNAFDFNTPFGRRVGQLLASQNLNRGDHLTAPNKSFDTHVEYKGLINQIRTLSTEKTEANGHSKKSYSFGFIRTGDKNWGASHRTSLHVDENGNLVERSQKSAALLNQFKLQRHEIAKNERGDYQKTYSLKLLKTAKYTWGLDRQIKETFNANGGVDQKRDIVWQKEQHTSVFFKNFRQYNRDTKDRFGNESKESAFQIGRLGWLKWMGGVGKYIDRYSIIFENAHDQVLHQGQLIQDEKTWNLLLKQIKSYHLMEHGLDGSYREEDSFAVGRFFNLYNFGYDDTKTVFNNDEERIEKEHFGFLFNHYAEIDEKTIDKVKNEIKTKKSTGIVRFFDYNIGYNDTHRTLENNNEYFKKDERGYAFNQYAKIHKEKIDKKKGITTKEDSEGYGRILGYNVGYNKTRKVTDTVNVRENIDENIDYEIKAVLFNRIGKTHKVTVDRTANNATLTEDAFGIGRVGKDYGIISQNSTKVLENDAGREEKHRKGLLLNQITKKKDVRYTEDNGRTGTTVTVSFGSMMSIQDLLQKKPTNGQKKREVKNMGDIFTQTVHEVKNNANETIDRTRTLQIGRIRTGLNDDGSEKSFALFKREARSITDPNDSSKLGQPEVTVSVAGIKLPSSWFNKRNKGAPGTSGNP